VYDTRAAKLLEVKEYEERSRAEATADLRSRHETLLNDLDHIEVALFEVESLDMLKRTHSRYFKSLKELSEHVVPKKSA
jgi:hypothetical protein